ncbi:MAG: triose-phosphate isomerase [Bacteroidales bacterium]|nr:triose-phosphate isomerase [Bacteroidales bacterium]MBR3980545.1 triose-phosphate isomerase [Bacteroidales bacterium]MBR4350311.1 triose-phosphate isomerase [Bacteroidales bacterium]MBR6266430.1 triose-phosphate isomerase [Bacteroidales bacterium]MCR4798956.1 triose-phosphate isomerase [Bacteroidales bacterium]
MRKKIVAGNWKCNTTLQEGVALAKEVNSIVKTSDVQVILGTPFIHLTEVVKLVDNKAIAVAAQNCAAEPKGAFTGEVSAAMVKSTGAQYVILGHSERRGYYGETSEILNKKLALALENGLTPIYCCGEALDVREAGKQNEFVINQLEETIFKLSADDFKKLVIAYEPIWAIGTGKTATSDQAEDMLKTIREAIAAKYGKAIADETSILYGGSCNAKNAKELFAKPNIDGGLIGGASLKAEDFNTIVMSF